MNETDLDNTSNLITQNEKPEVTVEEIIGLIDDGKLKKANKRIADFEGYQVAHLLESIPPAERLEIWEKFPDEKKGEVIIEISSSSICKSLIQIMSSESIATMIEDLDVDDIADIIEDIPDDKFYDLWQILDKTNQERLSTVMHYPEDSAGGIMDTNVITVRKSLSFGVVFRYLRQLGEIPENTNFLIVVDRDNNYLGVLPLSSLLTQEPNSIVADHIQGFDAIHVDQDSNEISNLFEQRDWVCAPVVDSDGKLVGRITIDDVVDVIREQAEKTVLSQAGLKGDDDIFSPILKSVPSRSVWLAINLLTAFLASWVIGWFDTTIEKVVALAVLMPIVASMGGVAGTQTLTLVVRSLALGRVNLSNLKWLLNKEIGVGLVNGAIWSIFICILVYFWFGEIGISLVIGTAILVNLFIGAAFGVLVPICLDKLKIDPALAGGVVLTTFTDVFGFLTFLGIAAIFLV